MSIEKNDSQYPTYSDREEPAEVGRPLARRVHDDALHLVLERATQVVASIDSMALCTHRQQCYSLNINFTIYLFLN